MVIVDFCSELSLYYGGGTLYAALRAGCTVVSHTFTTLTGLAYFVPWSNTFYLSVHCDS
jgi:hypothetical protein